MNRPSVQAMMEVRNLIVEKPQNEIVNKVGEVELYVKNLKTLVGHKWLDDNCVEAYMRLYSSNYPKVGVLNTHICSMMLKKGAGYVSSRYVKALRDLQGKEMILLPLNVPGHWILGVVWPEESKHTQYRRDQCSLYTAFCELK